MKTETASAPGSANSATAQGITASLRGYVYSLVGLIPVLGLPFSVAAMAQNAKAQKRLGKEWNPASRYLGAAKWLAPLGFLSTSIFLLLVCAIIPAISEGYLTGPSGGG
jgi:hypothetical protein